MLTNTEKAALLFKIVLFPHFSEDYECSNSIAMFHCFHGSNNPMYAGDTRQDHPGIIIAPIIHPKSTDHLDQ